MSRLLKAFIENETAIRRTLSRYFPRAQDIDDFAQETFLQAFAAEARYEIRAPKAYLIRVAKNLALNELARKSHSTTEFIEDSQDCTVLEDEQAISADKRLSDRQELATLAMAIAALPPKCRRVFILRRVEQLSFPEISKRLGISVSTAEKHAATGLLRCIDFLRRRGHDPDEICVRLNARLMPKTVSKNPVISLNTTSKKAKYVNADE